MKKRSPKLESTRKIEQDRPFWKFCLLVKSQRKKSKSTGLESKSTVKVLTGQIRVVRVGSVRVNGQLGDVVLTRRHC